MLYKTVQAHWKTFLAELEAAAEPPVLPAFVIAEVEAYLRCGILAHGLILAKCTHCGWCRPVAFRVDDGASARAVSEEECVTSRPFSWIE